jgi:hypothetical protein
VTLLGRVPTFEFSSADGEVRFMQFTLWREGVDQPIWSIVANNPPQEYSPPVNAPQPETESQLLEAMFRQSLARIASGEGNLGVRRLRYGEVPPGFLEQRPSQERPAELAAGDYFLSVAGEYAGTATFRVPA